MTRRPLWGTLSWGLGEYPSPQSLKLSISPTARSCLIHPGGSASKQAKCLGEKGRAKVRSFIEDGGGYVGICAGAYLATSDYRWSLHFLGAKVLDKAHWGRGHGNVRVRLTNEGRELLEAGDDSDYSGYSDRGAADRSFSLKLAAPGIEDRFCQNILGS